MQQDTPQENDARCKDAPIRNLADIPITDKLKQILADSNNRSDIIIISVYYTVYAPQELQTACLDSSLTLKNSQIRDLFFDMAKEHT